MGVDLGGRRTSKAKMILRTLRGTPTCYYGDEIGMENVPIPPEFVQDPPALNQPEIAHIVGRDPERTPMQWDASPNAGFAAAGVQPWLPVADDFVARNVAAQRDDPASMLAFYRALTTLRQSEPALMVGDYRSVDAGVDDIFAYVRGIAGGDQFLIVLNFGNQVHRLDLSAVASRGVIVLATDMVRYSDVDLSDLLVAANEGLLLRLD